jgi:stage V sporulation protein SpoVS
MMLVGKIFVKIVTIVTIVATVRIARIAVVVLPAPALGAVCSSLTEDPRQEACQASAQTVHQNLANQALNQALANQALANQALANSGAGLSSQPTHRRVRPTRLNRIGILRADIGIITADQGAQRWATQMRSIINLDREQPSVYKRDATITLT